MDKPKMLTPEQRTLLQRHVTIDGDGNVVGSDNTVQVTKVDAETYVAEINDRRIAFTVQDLRQIDIQQSQVTGVGDNWHVEGGIHYNVNQTASSDAPKHPQVHHNLPQPDYGEFVGRTAELAQVHRILRPYPHSRHAVVTIDGIGGIGKSALALEVAHRYLRDYDRLPDEERFDAIIWTSAKASVLTADGIAPRQQITRTLDDIYTAIAVTLEREAITRARPGEQDALVTKTLTQQRTLLLVDNLETVDDERVNAFLRELPAPTKAIVTTRHRIDVAYPIRLTGMPKEDALDLIAQECGKKDVTLTDAEAEKLYRRTGGVPLAVVWSVAQMGYGYGVDSVLRRLGERTGDIARFCFEGVMERIRGKLAHKLLMALSLFATDASREALGYVAGLQDDVLSRDEGLVKLERLSLINKESGRFSMLPLTDEFVKSEVAKHPHFQDDAEVALIQWYIHFTSRSIPRGRASFAIGASQQSVVEETQNLLMVLSLCYEREDLRSAMQLWDRISNLIWHQGLWNQFGRYQTLALEVAQVLGDLESYARFLSESSWLNIAVGQYDEAIKYIQEMLDISEELGRLEEKAYALRNMGEAYAGKGRLEEARSYLIDSIALARQVNSLGVEVRALGSLAKLEMKTGNCNRAYDLYEHCWRKNEKGLEDRESNEGIVSIVGVIVGLRGMGNAARHLGRHEEARELLEKALRWSQSEGIVKEIAFSEFSLAKMNAVEGKLKSAKRLAEKALRIFDQLDLEQKIKEVEHLLSNIKQLQVEKGI
jgi:LuxR family glucitol operon transcriptional activator